MSAEKLKSEQFSSAAALVRLLRVLLAGALVLFSAGVVAQQPASAIAGPRPIGVPESASPDEKGREILRVVIALVKHGDLRDTTFASNLLRLTIAPGVGLLASPKQTIPQQLVESFSYIFSDVGITRQSVRFNLAPSEVCLRSDEFLTAFNKEFGIGTEIFKDRGPPPRRVLPEQGWHEINHIHPRRSRDIYQSMPNWLSVSAVLIPGGCVGGIEVRRYESVKP